MRFNPAESQKYELISDVTHAASATAMLKLYAVQPWDRLVVTEQRPLMFRENIESLNMQTDP